MLKATLYVDWIKLWKADEVLKPKHEINFGGQYDLLFIIPSFHGIIQKVEKSYTDIRILWKPRNGRKHIIKYNLSKYLICVSSRQSWILIEKLLY